MSAGNGTHKTVQSEGTILETEDSLSAGAEIGRSPI